MLDLGAHADVQQTQRAMVFVDGTNLFYRLEGAKIKLGSLTGIIRYGEPYRWEYTWTRRPRRR